MVSFEAGGRGIIMGAAESAAPLPHPAKTANRDNKTKAKQIMRFFM